MQTKRFLIALIAGVALAGMQAFHQAAAADASSNAALTGLVTSAEEGAMEGVLVSAKKNGTNITITVVTDAQGRYRFPREKLDAGQYAIRIRIGRDMRRW